MILELSPITKNLHGLNLGLATSTSGLTCFTWIPWHSRSLWHRHHFYSLVDHQVPGYQVAWRVGNLDCLINLVPDPQVAQNCGVLFVWRVSLIFILAGPFPSSVWSLFSDLCFLICSFFRVFIIIDLLPSSSAGLSVKLVSMFLG